LTQARAHGDGLLLPLTHARDSASQLKASLRQYGIVLDCHVIPRPDAPADVAQRAAAACAALHALVSACAGAWFEEAASDNMLHAPISTTRSDLELVPELAGAAGRATLTLRPPLQPVWLRAVVTAFTPRPVGHTLTRLMLSGCALDGAAFAALGLTLFALPHPLTQLDLAATGLTAAGITALVQALGTRGPAVCDVSFNVLGDEGVAALADALPHGWPATLRAVSIGAGTGGVAVLAAAMLSPGCALRHLQLAHNKGLCGTTPAHQQAFVGLCSCGLATLNVIGCCVTEAQFGALALQLGCGDDLLAAPLMTVITDDNGERAEWTQRIFWLAGKLAGAPLPLALRMHKTNRCMPMPRFAYDAGVLSLHALARCGELDTLTALVGSVPELAGRADANGALLLHAVLAYLCSARLPDEQHATAVRAVRALLRAHPAAAQQPSGPNRVLPLVLAFVGGSGRAFMPDELVAALVETYPYAARSLIYVPVEPVAAYHTLLQEALLSHGIFGLQTCAALLRAFPRAVEARNQAGKTALHLLLTEPPFCGLNPPLRWEAARLMLQAWPTAAVSPEFGDVRQGHSQRALLHCVLLRPEVPAAVVQHILDAAPSTLCTPDARSRLPLHYAARGVARQAYWHACWLRTRRRQARRTSMAHFRCTWLLQRARRLQTCFCSETRIQRRCARRCTTACCRYTWRSPDVLLRTCWSW
jgi:hypothetical protein